MRLLLDSHVVLWWLEDNQDLGSRCRDLISDADEVFVSAVTPWELGIKAAIGKLELPGSISEAIIASGFAPLAIAGEHAEVAPALPQHHRDPFDRMLAAQSEIEGLALVSVDTALDAFGIQRVWPNPPTQP